MISRRSFVAALSALPIARVLHPFGSAQGTSLTPVPEGRASATPEDLTKYVKIAIGTGGHGHTYPGATVPFGIVQLSPTLTTMAGTGARLPLLRQFDRGFSSHAPQRHRVPPTCSRFSVDAWHRSGKNGAGLRQNPGDGYRSRFSHDEEIAGRATTQ